jgi:cytochrome c-type biogenesis protein CcsB
MTDSAQISKLFLYEGYALTAVIVIYFLAMSAHIAYAISKSKRVGDVGYALAVIGALVHLATLVMRSIEVGRAPYGNFYESALSISFSLMAFYVIGDRFFKVRWIGVIVTPLAFLAALGTASLERDIYPLMPALRSYWLTYHVLCGVVAYGAFASAFAASVLYLIKKKWPRGRIANMVPALEALDRITYRMIAFGLPFQTLLLILGAVWAEEAWGTYWSWDPKETWALITWLVYLAYMHTRIRKGWKGVPTAILSISGFVVVVFTYLGVSFWLVGLHSYLKQ